jgi:hypothetical protein
MDSQTHVTGRKPVCFRRPLHSFSLRTMFIAMTALCCWLGRELHVVRSRRDLIESFTSQSYGITYAGPLDRARIPWYRQWLGDRSVELINLRGSLSEETIDRIRAAFPEAGLMNRHTGPAPAVRRSAVP